MLPLDLHVLSLPLAFILSQDQTLHCIIFYVSSLILTLLILSKELTLLDKLFFSVLASCTVISLFNELVDRFISNGLQRYALFLNLQIFSSFFEIFLYFCLSKPMAGT